MDELYVGYDGGYDFDVDPGPDPVDVAPQANLSVKLSQGERIRWTDLVGARDADESRREVREVQDALAWGSEVFEAGVDVFHWAAFVEIAAQTWLAANSFRSRCRPESSTWQSGHCTS